MLAHVRVADAAEVDPHVRVLVPEERRESQMLLPLERPPAIAAGPRLPGLGPDRVRRGAERQHVQDHRLVVAPPVVGQVSAARPPAERDRGRAGLRPGPVGARVERVRHRADLGLGARRAIEVGPAEQRPGQEQRRVDGRELDVLEARPVRWIPDGRPRSG